MPIEAYIEEAKRQWGNTNFYVKLPADPTEVFKRKINRKVQSGRDMSIITKKEKDCLTVNHPRVPTFNLLPKIHKNLERPPGHPIVEGVGGLSETACIYTYFYVQPLLYGLNHM